MAFDSNRNLYTANYDDGTISKISSAGVVNQFATGLAGPRGLTFDSSGNLYVANIGANTAGTGTISKITSAGVVSQYVGGLSYPIDLAFDSGDNLFVANEYGTISEINPSGTVSQFAGGLNTPLYVTVQLPEPSTAALVLLCGVELLGRRRKTNAVRASAYLNSDLCSRFIRRT